MDVPSAALGSTRARAAVTGVLQHELLLLGQPSLQEYLDFVRDKVAGGDAIDPRALCDEWRAANDFYGVLEVEEAGIAEGIECHDIGRALAPLAEQVLSDPCFRRAYDSLPTRVGVVELDRLLVYQTRVTQDFIDDLKARLGPAPDPEAVLRFCLPLGGQNALLKIRRAGPRRYTFTSDSTDLRFHEPVLLGPDQIGGYAATGPVGGALGLVVGFSSNMLNAIRSENGRMLLHNGYHRACALRALGVTHAPCVIQEVTRRDELALTVPRRVLDAAAFYFKSARPPMLKDFFNPRLRKLLPVPPTRRVVEVSFEVREYELAD